MDEEFGNLGFEQPSFGSEYNASVVNLDNNQKSSSQQRKLSQKDIQSLNTSQETASETISSGSSETANASSAPIETASASSSASGSASSSSVSSGASGATSSAGASAGSAATVAGSTAAGVGLVTVVVGISTTLGLACSIPSDSIKTSYDKSTMFEYSFVAEFREEGDLYARVKGTNFSDEKNYKLIFDEAEPVEGEEKIYTTAIEGIFEGEFLAGVQYAFDIYSLTAGIENNYYHELFMGEFDKNKPTPTPVQKTYYVLIDGVSKELTKVTKEGSTALEQYSLTESLENGSIISFKENDANLGVNLELDSSGEIMVGNNVGLGEVDNSFSVLTSANNATITLSKYESYWSVWVSGYSEPTPVGDTYYVLIDGEALEMNNVAEEGSTALDMYATTSSLTAGSTISFSKNNESLSVSLEKDPDSAKLVANNNVSDAQSENIFNVICTVESATIKLSYYESFGWTVWVTGYDTTKYYVYVKNEGDNEPTQMEMTRAVPPDSGAIETLVVEGVLLNEGDEIYFTKEDAILSAELLKDAESGRPLPNNNVNADGDSFYVQKSVSMGKITISRFTDYWGVWVSGNESNFLYYVAIDGEKYGMPQVTLDPSSALEDYMLDGITLSEGQMIKFYDVYGDEMEVSAYQSEDSGEILSGNNVSVTADGGMIIQNATNTRITLSKFSSYWGVWVAGYVELADGYKIGYDGSNDHYDFQKVSPTPSNYVAQYEYKITPEQTLAAGIDLSFYTYSLTDDADTLLTDISSAGSLNNFQKYELAGTANPLFRTRTDISSETTVTLNVDSMGDVSVFVSGYESPNDLFAVLSDSTQSTSRYAFSQYSSLIDDSVNNVYQATVTSATDVGTSITVNGSIYCNELIAVDEYRQYYTGYESGTSNNLIGRTNEASREDSTLEVKLRSANYDTTSPTQGTPESITVTLYECFDHYEIAASGFELPFTIEEVTMEIQSIQTPTANVNALVYDFSAPDFDENAGDALSIMVIGDPSSGQNGQSVASGTWTPGGTNNYATLENFTEASENIYITITLTHDSKQYVVAFFTLQY